MGCLNFASPQNVTPEETLIFYTQVIAAHYLSVNYYNYEQIF